MANFVSNQMLKSESNLQLIPTIYLIYQDEKASDLKYPDHVGPGSKTEKERGKKIKNTNVILLL